MLDTVLEEYVEDSREPVQIAKDHGFDLQEVKRVVRMIEGSEYKRRQAAPGLKVTSKAFGVGRRIPIAQRYREA